MVRIFRDFKMVRLEVDWEYPGVFKSQKANKFGYLLISIT
jgi:GH18 family chitinase